MEGVALRVLWVNFEDQKAEEKIFMLNNRDASYSINYCFDGTKNAKNTGVLKASQDIEGFHNTRPNVVVQKVVLGKKKRPRDDDETEEEGETGEELIGKLSEFFSRENLDEDEETRSLDLLRRVISRVQYRRLNRYPDDFEFFDPKYEKRHRRRRPIVEEFESEEEPRKLRIFSEENEGIKRRRKARYRNTECFECKRPKDKFCLKKRKRLIKKDEEEVEPKGSASPDILYIPKFDDSD